MVHAGVKPGCVGALPVNANCMAAGNLYKDFRAPRTPTENGNLARNFRIKERMNFQIRGEFVNVFNRLLMPAPGTANPQAAPSKNNLGIYTTGFGVIPAYFAPNVAPPPANDVDQPVSGGPPGHCDRPVLVLT